MRWPTSDRKMLTMRPMQADDAPLVKRSLGKLSKEARRNRFFSSSIKISDELVESLTDVDPGEEFALVVLHPEGEEDVPIAGGRFVHTDEPGCCEFSLLVGDDWQGQGIGSRLLKVLIKEARRRRLQKMIGYVLADNRSMLILARERGFDILPSGEGEAIKLVSLDLPPLPVSGWQRLLGRLRRPQAQKARPC